jgi:hypothetical protein
MWMAGQPPGAAGRASISKVTPGKPDSALNALELLSFLKTAAHITGSARYETEYRKAAFELKYLEQTTRLAELTHEINYSDEELAMLSVYPIFRYERDPSYLDFYRHAADQWWRNIQREKNPLWTVIYQLSKPSRPVDLAGAVWTLYRIPMDTIEWTVRNSNRRDIVMDVARDRFREPQSVTLLAPDERPIMKWNGNPFRIDGGNGVRTIVHSFSCHTGWDDIWAFSNIRIGLQACEFN